MKGSFIYSAQRFLAIYSVWWIFFTCIQVFVLHKLNLSWELCLIDSLVSNGLLALFGVVTMLIYKFYQPGRSNWIYRMGYILALVAGYQYLIEIILKKLLASETSYLIFLTQSLPVRFIIALLIITFITIINWLMYYLNEKKEKEKNQTEIESMMREAELVKLRQQLQPHFLFNSLNSINALVVTQPNEARKMVQQLSEFLRGTLKKDEQKLIPLKDELSHLQLYLEIEKVRFGHRLNVRIDNCETCLDAAIPPLLLQPVVENAIKFGLYDTTGEVTITIDSKLTDHSLVVAITNPFDEQTQRSKTGNSFGLESIQRRLYLIFARKDLLKTKSDNAIFTTTLTIPQLSK